jgi:calcineurin-like phosphoesterase family protein
MLYLSFLNIQLVFAFTIPSSHFAIAGDWACRPETVTTINNIKARNPDIIFALGDLSYQKTGDCWLNEISGLEKNKIKIIMGNHEEEPGIPSSLPIQYKKAFALNDTYYSFNFENVHFTIMDSNIPFDVNSAQYRFVTSDFLRTTQNSSINWKIVLLHHPIYTSPTEFYKGNDEMRKIYHPIFDNFRVDLVLQAHNHNYQRTYPLTYNHSISDENPIITSRNNTIYHNPSGEVYTVTGTAGKSFYNFLAKENYIVTQFLDHGFLDVALINNGTQLDCRFYSNEGIVKDHFTIIK